MKIIGLMAALFCVTEIFCLDICDYLLKWPEIKKRVSFNFLQFKKFQFFCQAFFSISQWKDFDDI